MRIHRPQDPRFFKKVSVVGAALVVTVLASLGFVAKRTTDPQDDGVHKTTPVTVQVNDDREPIVVEVPRQMDSPPATVIVRVPDTRPPSSSTSTSTTSTTTTRPPTTTTTRCTLAVLGRCV